MPQYIVPQPDGRFAIFDGRVDDFHVVGNASVEDAASTVFKKYEGQPDPAVRGGGDDGLDMWRWGLHMTAEYHGLERAYDVINDALPPEMWDEWKTWIYEFQQLEWKKVEK